MKTKLRKEFNKIDDNFAIDDTTVIEDLGIDTEKIVATVMAGVSAKKKSKSVKRKLPLILIAAAVSTAIVGTTVLAATGVLFPLSDKFQGDTSALSFHNNGTFKFNSKDSNLQGNFLGYVGDKDFTLATIEITKKDGSAFSDMDGTIPASDELYDEASFRYDIQRPEGVALYKVSNYHKDSAEYFLSKDKKTLTVYLTIETDDLDHKGTKVSFDSDHFYTYKLNKLLESHNCISEDVYRDGFASYPKDKCKWVYEDGKYNLYSIDTTPCSANFSVSFELDKNPDDSIDIEISGDKYSNVLNPSHKASIKISPFEISLESTSVYDTKDIKKDARDNEPEDYICENFMDYSSFVPNINLSSDGCFSPANSKVLMKDGTVYYFSQKFESGLQVENDTVSIDESVIMLYSEIPDTFSFSFEDSEFLRPYVVDVNQIAKIMIDSDVIYTASGSEKSEFPEEDNVLFFCWNLAEMRNLLKSYPVTFNSISVSCDNYDGNEIGYKYSDVYLLFEGSASDITNTVSNLTKEKDRGLLIKEIMLYTVEGSDRYQAEVYIVNPYLLSRTDKYNEIKAEIMENYKQYDWVSVCKEYFANGTVPDKDVPVSIHSIEELYAPEDDEPEIERPPYTPPANKVSKDSVIFPDMSAHEVKTWSESEITDLVNNLSTESAVVSEVQFNNNYSDVYLDLNINCQAAVFDLAGTRNGIYNFVNKMSKYEEQNLFISCLGLTASDENNDVYYAHVTVVNPLLNTHDSALCNKFTSLIKTYSGVVSKAEEIEGIFEAFKDTDVKEVYYDFCCLDSSGITTSSYVTFDLPSGIFNDINNLKNSLNDSGKYTVSEVMSASKFGNTLRCSLNVISVNS